MREWMESLKENYKKAESEYFIDDFTNLCIRGRKMLLQLIYLLKGDKINDIERVLKEKNFEEIKAIYDFFSEYEGEDDMFYPYLANKWQGLPSKEKGEQCKKYIDRIMDIASKVKFGSSEN